MPGSVRDAGTPGRMRAALGVLLLAVAPAVGAEWTRIGGDDASGIYLDLGSMRETEDGRRAWVLYELASPTPDGARSVRSLTEVDCSGGRSRHLQGDFFEQPKASGRLIQGFRTATEWCYAAPGTVGLLVLEAICSLPRAPAPRRTTAIEDPLRRVRC